MKINLGIAPIAWSNDDMPDLGGDTPIETCLFEAQSAGFKGIELWGVVYSVEDTDTLFLYKIGRASCRERV